MKLNKLMTLFFLIMALAINVNPVFAGDEPDEALEKAADLYNKNKSNDKYKVVCKREAPVGSRIKKKVCRTVEMVDNSQREAREKLGRMRTSVGNPSQRGP